jgi:hypothetical protein
MTNVFFKSISNQVIGILKGNWCLRRRQRLLLHSTTHPSPSLRATLRLWYNLHSYVLFAKGEKSSSKGSNDSVFGDLCQRGRKHEPKAKGPHHHLIKKKNFSIGMIFKLVSHCVQKGEKSSIFKINILKPS